MHDLREPPSKISTRKLQPLGQAYSPLKGGPLLFILLLQVASITQNHKVPYLVMKSGQVPLKPV